MSSMDIKEIRRLNFVFLIEKALADDAFKNQKEMAVALGLKSGSYISQLKGGERKIEDVKARELEQFFKLKPYDFDKPLYDKTISEGYMQSGILRPSPSHFNVLETSDNTYQIDTANFVLVPKFDVKGACGFGYTNSDELIKGGIVFKESWLRKKGISPKFGCSAIMGGDGDSMSPTIEHNSLLLANLAITTYEQLVTGNIYAFVANNELRIKRLFKIVKDGGLRISSDNPNKEKFPDEYLTKEEIDNIKIVGHIPWRAGDI